MSEILKYLSVRFQATNKTYTFSTTDNSIDKVSKDCLDVILDYING